MAYSRYCHTSIALYFAINNYCLYERSITYLVNSYLRPLKTGHSCN